MEIVHKDSTKAEPNKKPKLKQNPDVNPQSGGYKAAEDLGEGRWKYRGKTYKERQPGGSN